VQRLEYVIAFLVRQKIPDSVEGIYSHQPHNRVLCTAIKKLFKHYKKPDTC